MGVAEEIPEGVDARSLAGGVPSRITPRPSEVRRLRRLYREAQQRRARRHVMSPVLELDASEIYVSPPCDHPAPPEALARQISHYSSGPDGSPAPGAKGYDLSKAGAGFQACYRATRDEFFRLGKTRAALLAAAEFGGFDLTRDLLFLMVDQSDVTRKHAYALELRLCRSRAEKKLLYDLFARRFD